MRASGVVFSVIIACAISGWFGYAVTDRIRAEDITQLQRERDKGLIREQELRKQLEEAMAARTALAEEARHMQADLTERITRLEEIANRLVSEDKLRQEGRGE